MPDRIQRQRTKGWKMPENTVYVGRGTQWGNPFDDPALYGDNARRAGLFRKFLMDAEATCLGPRPEEVVPGVVWPVVLTELGERGQTVLRRLSELRGKNLACWCPAGCACHADVLIEFANKDS
ncbi:DUF4326 domain-containing protein [Magnetospirillum aberrantis]|nr:DUF4326 domain-containing protein [Magnetospirillum aberrantis]